MSVKLKGETMERELLQIFNKIDIALRDEKIRMQYKLLRVQGMSCKNAREELSKQKYVYWTEEPHYLSVETIQRIIYGIKQ